MSSALIKTTLGGSLAESIYKEITYRSGRYFYFLGGTIDREDHDNIDYATQSELIFPVDTVQYERDTRNYIVATKAIQPNDIAFLIKKIDWVSNVVYDMYDDRLGTEVIGIDLQAGGQNYTSNANITITGGNGIGANASVYVSNGKITSAILNWPGINYTSAPNVTIQDSTGTGANATAVIGLSSSGAQNLQSASFYVVTDEFNIYKCLDNNDGALSTQKPVGIITDPFVTSDGYKWKFMCNIPVSLRNKFSTTTEIPITTALKNQFYSSGEIKNITVLDTGDNYTSATLTVSGDGYLKQDPYYIVSTTINFAGTGYSNANTTITIDPPIIGANNWSNTAVYLTGTILLHNNNLYEVVTNGTSGISGPVHTFGVESNGSTGLKYLGTQATGNVTITGGGISAVTLFGSLKRINLSERGTGYISAPTVTITGGGGANATAYATILNNSINRVYITAIGNGFTSVPTVLIGTQWSANSNVTLNSQIFYGLNLYTVTAAGTTNVTAPTHISGTAKLGTANVTYAGKAANAIATLKYGAGYLKEPNVTINGIGSNASILVQVQKSEAILTPYIENGGIKSIIIEDGGIGYNYGTVTATGDGNNARFSIDFAQGDLNTLQSDIELLAEPGAIHTIKVVSKGYNYSIANVSITGDGTGATASIEILNSRIHKIRVNNPGTNYTWANVTITGDGHGAIARAILPPPGGHGKNAVDELLSRSLGFHTTIGKEKNQGFVVNNDFRQFGILKDIYAYDSTNYFTETNGSTCWVISGEIDNSSYDIDDILYRLSDNYRFLVVALTTSGALVVSLDNGVPETGDIMSKAGATSFTVTGVLEPDVDKYSGKLLYIDNKLGFTTTEEQSVSIKTVLKF